MCGEEGGTQRLTKHVRMSCVQRGGRDSEVH